MCYFPIRMKVKGRFIDVPCGKCRICLQHKKNEITLKLCLENECQDKTPYFGTLTLNELHYDFFANSNVYISYVVKRLILYLKYHLDKDLRYFITSEYGSKTKRLHFHFIIWSDKDPLNLFRDYWRFGFVNCQPSKGIASFKYCSKYIVKQTGVLRFMSTKPPLGFDYWLSTHKINETEFIKSFLYGKINYSGISFAVPKSYYECYERNRKRIRDTGLLSSRIIEFIEGFCTQIKEDDNGVPAGEYQLKFPLPPLTAWYDFIDEVDIFDYSRLHIKPKKDKLTIKQKFAISDTNQIFIDNDKF